MIVYNRCSPFLASFWRWLLLDCPQSALHALSSSPMLGRRLCGIDVHCICHSTEVLLGTGTSQQFIREQLQKSHRCMEASKEAARSSLKGGFALIGKLIGYGKKIHLRHYCPYFNFILEPQDQFGLGTSHLGSLVIVSCWQQTRPFAVNSESLAKV